MESLKFQARLQWALLSGLIAWVALGVPAEYRLQKQLQPDKLTLVSPNGKSHILLRASDHEPGLWIMHNTGEATETAALKVSDWTVFGAATPEGGVLRLGDGVNRVEEITSDDISDAKNAFGR